MDRRCLSLCTETSASPPGRAESHMWEESCYHPCNPVWPCPSQAVLPSLPGLPKWSYQGLLFAQGSTAGQLKPQGCCKLPEPAHQPRPLNPMTTLYQVPSQVVDPFPGSPISRQTGLGPEAIKQMFYISLKAACMIEKLKITAPTKTERHDRAAEANQRLPSLFARCSGVIRTAVKGFRKKNSYHYLQPAASGALDSAYWENGYTATNMSPKPGPGYGKAVTCTNDGSQSCLNRAVTQHSLRFPRSCYTALACRESCGWICMPASVVVVVV